MKKNRGRTKVKKTKLLDKRWVLYIFEKFGNRMDNIKRLVWRLLLFNGFNLNKVESNDFGTLPVASFLTELILKTFPNLVLYNWAFSVECKSTSTSSGPTSFFFINVFQHAGWPANKTRYNYFIVLSLTWWMDSPPVTKYRCKKF